MTARCTICTHQLGHLIDLEIIKGEQSNRALAVHFQVGEKAIRDHRINHLAAKLEQAIAERQKAEKLDLNAMLTRVVKRMDMMLAACHEWLLDPKDENRYTLDARANEIEVVYIEKLVRKRDNLATLLARCEDGLHCEVVTVTSKFTDPRVLILKTSEQFKGHMEILGKLTGAFQQPRLNDSDRADLARKVRQDFELYCKVSEQLRVDQGVNLPRATIEEVVASGFDQKLHPLVRQELERIQ